MGTCTFDNNSAVITAGVSPGTANPPLVMLINEGLAVLDLRIASSYAQACIKSTTRYRAPSATSAASPDHIALGVLPPYRTDRRGDHGL